MKETQGRTVLERRTVFTKAQTCQCVESRLPSLGYLMCVEKWKAMRWDGRKSRHLEGPCVSCEGVGFCSEAFGSC